MTNARLASRRAPIAGGWLTATLAAVGVAILLPLATFLASAWLLGWQLQSVQSGSMEPTYPVGSLLVVAAVDPSTIQPGSTIVFRDPGDAARLVSHRVVDRAPGHGLAFITKGDANAAQDLVPVGADRVIGRPLWSVSHLGNVIDLLAWPRSLLLILIPGALLLIDARPGRRRRAPSSSAHAESHPMFCGLPGCVASTAGATVATNASASAR